MVSIRSAAAAALAAALYTPSLGACAPGEGAIGAGSASAESPALFVAGKFGNTLSKIDLETGEEVLRRDSCTNPHELTTSPDEATLWVSARGSNQAFALDPAAMEVRSTVATGRFPLRIVIRPQGDVAVTPDLQDGGLSVIDLASAKLIRSIAVSSPGEAQERFQVTILWSDDGSKIYVAETASDTVAEVDYASGAVLRRLKVGIGGTGGDGMAILP